MGENFSLIVVVTGRNTTFILVLKSIHLSSNIYQVTCIYSCEFWRRNMPLTNIIANVHIINLALIDRNTLCFGYSFPMIGYWLEAQFIKFPRSSAVHIAFKCRGEIVCFYYYNEGYIMRKSKLCGESWRHYVISRHFV